MDRMVLLALVVPAYSSVRVSSVAGSSVGAESAVYEKV